ncbi:MAG: nucleotide sugar dehydrogenase [Inquilinus sp.]|nr:nucleotide sugar dehydrogenase [Inquilinus sp.]
MNRIETIASHAPNLRAKIDAGEARIGVIGLGYVGLPLARLFAKAGHPTIGFDIDPAKVEELNAGRSYIRHLPASDIADIVESGRFSATVDFSRAGACDALIVCVPTPLTRHREPDLTYIEKTAEALLPGLRPGHLVVLESTSYPGTTDGVLRPILARAGLAIGRELFVAYSPEREDPGNRQFSTDSIPKVVGADDAASRELALALYGRIIGQTVPVSSTRAAEAVKITENVFRSVNIALVNELKVIFEAMGIDVWEVIDAAKTKPFGFMPFYPGPGLGGHCIPIDPFYLTWKAREHEIPTRFIELAGEINTAMPGYVVDRLVGALSERLGKAARGARILLFGIAYKKDVDDMRESPALKLIEKLEALGATVDFHDPYVPQIPPTRAYPDLAGRRSVPWDIAAFGGYDAALIVADHGAVDYAALAASFPLVVDTRNATRAVVDGRERIVRA